MAHPDVEFLFEHMAGQSDSHHHYHHHHHHRHHRHPGIGQPVDTTKFYELLGVEKSPSTTQADIKKAFRNKARELHPDRHPQERAKYQALFQEVEEAHSILSDRDKREVYDVRGADEAKSVTRSRSERKAPPLREVLDVTLEDLFRGPSRKVRIRRSKDSAPARRCGQCGGQGVVMFLRRVGPMVIQDQGECDQCHGTGLQAEYESVMIDVHIPQGGKHGEVFTVVGEGHRRQGCAAGDVQFKMRCAKHETFTRQGADLGMTYTLSLKEAMCGYQIKVAHVSGNILVVSNTEGEVVQPGSLVCVHTKGMPQRFSSHVRGHLYIKMDVKLPMFSDLPPGGMDDLRRLLPGPDASEVSGAAPRSPSTTTSTSTAASSPPMAARLGDIEDDHKEKEKKPNGVPQRNGKGGGGGKQSARSRGRNSGGKGKHGKKGRKDKRGKRKNKGRGQPQQRSGGGGNPRPEPQANSKAGAAVERAPMDVDEEGDAYFEECVAEACDPTPKPTPASSRSAYDEDEHEEEGIPCRQM